MKKMYCVNLDADMLIKEVLVSKQTECSVFLDGRRYHLISKSKSFHDDYDEACWFLLKRSQRRLSKVRKEFDMAEKVWDQVKKVLTKEQVQKWAP